MKKRSTLRLVSKIAFYSIFVIVLALVAMLFISKFTGKVFFVGNRTAVWILTDSMDDAIPPQTYILIEKADPADVKKDDIITFYSDDPVLGGSLNTHRVLEVIDGGKEFVTKGDHNLAEDKYTAKGDKLVGVYVDDIPLLTAIGRFFAKPYGLGVTIGLIILLSVGVYLPELLKKKPDEAKNTEQSTVAQPTAEQNTPSDADAEAAKLAHDEEIKRKAIEEYLKKQSQENAGDQQGDSNNQDKT
jgi:signal peptidase